ncbi:hypothetical protein [Nodularia sphaerocarpa]|uniref:hypothetical protein n=1 Tax=Nodularia sphaerocarpa TaxID=137816 RepID=UPI00232CA553|nr:hypothetical protein [Nodularia sphaerocarpa]
MNIRLDGFKELLEEAREQASEQHISLNQWMIAAIQEKLARPSVSAASATPQNIQEMIDDSLSDRISQINAQIVERLKNIDKFLGIESIATLDTTLDKVLDKKLEASMSSKVLDIHQEEDTSTTLDKVLDIHQEEDSSPQAQHDRWQEQTKIAFDAQRKKAENHDPAIFQRNYRVIRELLECQYFLNEGARHGYTKEELNQNKILDNIKRHKEEIEKLLNIELDKKASTEILFNKIIKAMGCEITSLGKGRFQITNPDGIGIEPKSV